MTVVGLYRQGHMRTLIHGDSLTQGAIQEELDQADLLITFFGTVFDMPIYKPASPACKSGFHFDLCFAARRVGLRGGLKSIEKDLNIARESDLLDLDGMEAVRLWHQSRAGNDAALDQLVRYNAADTRNLEPLATSSTTNSPCDTDLPGRPTTDNMEHQQNQREWAGCGRTDPGLVRTTNQDSFLVDNRRRLWAVADGMVATPVERWRAVWSSTSSRISLRPSAAASIALTTTRSNRDDFSLPRWLEQAHTVRPISRRTKPGRLWHGHHTRDGPSTAVVSPTPPRPERRRQSRLSDPGRHHHPTHARPYVA